MILRHVSVFPTWLELSTTIVPVAGLLASSMMPRKYGVRDVYHLPASALASGLNIRQLSAHWLTVNLGGGLKVSKVLFSHSSDHRRESIGAEFAENFSNKVVERDVLSCRCSRR